MCVQKRESRYTCTAIYNRASEILRKKKKNASSLGNSCFGSRFDISKLLDEDMADSDAETTMYPKTPRNTVQRYRPRGMLSLVFGFLICWCLEAFLEGDFGGCGVLLGEGIVRGYCLCLFSIIASPGRIEDF